MTATESDRPARSRRGCWTCRAKKVKCDEERPRCRRCSRLDLVCDYAPRPRKKYTRRGDDRIADGESPSTASHSHIGTEESYSIPQYYPTGSLTPPPPLPTPALPHDTDAASDGDLAPQSFGLQSLSIDCLSILLPTDHEAITCFRTVISISIDTKDPEYSVPTVVWRMAQTQPMVLHMVCALGSHQRFYENSRGGQRDTSCFESTAVEHYGASMRLMAQIIYETADSPTLDTTLATLWLMIVYEQKFGDGSGAGLKAHLVGAASVLHSRLRKLNEWHAIDKTGSTDQDPSSPLPLPHWPISPFSARMIVWISFLDGGAAFYGLGGHFNRSVGEIMVDLAENNTKSRLRGFLSIHQYSALMSSDIWGPEYPQGQLLEDIQSRQLFYLYGQVGQLRFILAELAAAYNDSEDTDRHGLAQDTAHALRDMRQKYWELLEVAGRLDFPSANGKERNFIANVRFIVPFYHAIVLCYFRIANRNAPANEQQRTSLRDIITLAHQSHTDEGEKAMARITWPLFIAALETEDLVHRDWIMARFSHLQHQGENCRRAFAALKVAQTEERTRHVRVDCIGILENDDVEKFVI